MNSSENRILKIAFLISIIFHALILIPFNISSFINRKKNEKTSKITVTYKKIKLKETKDKKGKDKKPTSTDKKISSKKKKTAKKDKEKSKEKQKANKTNGKKIVKVSKETKPAITGKKEIPKQQPKNEKKEYKQLDKKPAIVGLEQVPEDQRVAFVEYYKFIRNKIEAVAQGNRPGCFKEGEVNIIFRLNSKGELLNVKIQNHMSSNDKILRSHAIRDIKVAAPFLPFPKGLTADELEFRITIEFHI